MFPELLRPELSRTEPMEVVLWADLGFMGLGGQGSGTLNPKPRNP